MAFTTTIESHWNGEDVKVKGKQVVGKTIFETGLVIEGQAKLLAPKKTGRLAGSITTQASDKGTEVLAPAIFWEDLIMRPIDENQVFVGTAVFYAPYNEFGTLHQDAQPFLRPALDLAMGRVLTIGSSNGRLIFKDYLQ